MTFLLSGWLIPFEIPAMLLQRVSMPVNGSPAPAAALGSAWSRLTAVCVLEVGAETFHAMSSFSC